MQISAVAINGVRWGAQLALTDILSYFPELELKLDLLGSDYNADLSRDEMETLWTQTCRASESLSSRVPPSAAHNPPDDSGEE
jgi:hypothetical protein